MATKVTDSLRQFASRIIRFPMSSASTASSNNCSPASNLVSQLFMNYQPLRSFSSINNQNLRSITIARKSLTIMQRVTCKPPLQGSVLIHTSENNKVTSSLVPFCKKQGFLASIFKRTTYGKSTLIRSGYNLYEKIALQTDIVLFFKVLSLPDTFFSWFRITVLQVWLVAARLQAEGEDGKIARDGLMSAMWEDTQAKIKELGERSTNKSRDLEALNSYFQTSLVSYDEGLLGSDVDLAGAVWRRLIRMEKNSESGDYDEVGDGGIPTTDIEDFSADPRCLESIVAYIRQQIHVLDSVDQKLLLAKGEISFIKPELPESFTQNYV